MRFMVIVKATAESEAGVMPTTAELEEMMKYNEELVKAGVMLAGEGLHPTAKGFRVQMDGAKRTLVDGPFAETKELIAGYWIWEVKSREEAIAWAKRCPNVAGAGKRGEIEVRQIFDAADFGDALTPELRAKEEALRQQAAARG